MKHFHSAYCLLFVTVALLFGRMAAAQEPNSSEEKRYAIVTVCVANMREEPRHAAEMATQCPLGMPLRVREGRSGWYAVTTPEGYDCWVTADSIVSMTKAEFNQWIKASKVIYLKNLGTVRSEPADDSVPVSDIAAGCVAVQESVNGSHVKIRFPDGRTGWILRNDCADFETWKRETKPTAESVLKMAFEFMGVAYFWGGTTPKMFDCSGLTKHCFFMNGVIIPRNASQQAKSGLMIDIDNGLDRLEKGDLVFFGRNRVTHVGIYIENGLFIHESGRVRLDNLIPGAERHDRSLATSFVGARRFIGTTQESGIIPIAEHPLYQVQP